MEFDKNSTAEKVAENFAANAGGKFVIVTGGAGGLGCETARVLCKYGADVTISCRHEKQGLEAVAKIKESVGLSLCGAGLDRTQSQSPLCYSSPKSGDLRDSHGNCGGGGL